jgi:hypothetical protein
MFKVYLSPKLRKKYYEHSLFSLAMHKSLDVEAKRRANAHYILIVQLLENRSLSGIIESSEFQLNRPLSSFLR